MKMIRFFILLLYAVVSPLFLTVAQTSYHDFLPLAVGNVYQYSFDSTRTISQLGSTIYYLHKTAHSYLKVESRQEQNNSILWTVSETDSIHSVVLGSTDSSYVNSYLFIISEMISDSNLIGISNSLVWNSPNNFYRYSILNSDRVFGYYAIISPATLSYTYDTTRFSVDAGLIYRHVGGRQGLNVSDASSTKIALLTKEFTVGNGKASKLNNDYNFRLYANYPNPFNSSTIISYCLPEQSNIWLQLYDISGEMIAEVFHGMQSAGEHTYRLDIKALKCDMATGIYFLRLRAGTRLQTQKLMYLK